MPSCLRASSSRPAFSFIEVLFAVILLGIGFIMIAGIFPVAIEQSAQIANDAQGAQVCRDAMRSIESMAASFQSTVATNMVATNGPLIFAKADGLVHPFEQPEILAMGGGAFFSADRRYAWAAFYRRDPVDAYSPSPLNSAAAGAQGFPNAQVNPYVQIIIIALQNPDFPNYNPTVTPYLPWTGPTLSTPATGYIDSATSSVDVYGNSVITITGNTTTGTPDLSNVAPGAFVVVSCGTTPVPIAPPWVPANTLTGRVLKLGNLTTDTAFAAATPGTATYVLVPGMDLTATDPKLSGQPVYIIGRAPVYYPHGNPSVASSPPSFGAFIGPNQDIASLSQYIRVSTTNN